MRVIEVNDLVCTFGGNRALDGLSFSVEAGSVIGVVGPNGAGKTTLIDSMCGLVRPQQGEVRIFGEDVLKAGAALKSRLGVLPQETALYAEVTAIQNLRFAAALFHIENSQKRIAQVLELVGLTERATDVVRTFSGGMQRRLAIARALLHNPPLLILDEPTVGVDVEARHLIWAHIRSLKAKGRTVILTTNYLDEAEALCDRMLILRKGKILSEGSPAELARRTGRCLEITCAPDFSSRLRASLGSSRAVLRSEIFDFGLRLYLASEINPEEIIHQARSFGPIEGFRARSPDLAEVFVSLSSGHEAQP